MMLRKGIRPTIGELKVVFPGFELTTPGRFTYKGYDIIQNQYGHFMIKLNGEGIEVAHSTLSDTLQVIDRLDGKPEVMGVNICGGW